MIRAGSAVRERRARPRARRARARRRRRRRCAGARMNTPRTELLDALDVDVGLERVDLASVRVALDADVHDTRTAVRLPSTRVGQHDHARARAEHRHAGGDALDGRARRGRTPARACSIVVDSPPGITRHSTPARSSAVRTSTGDGAGVGEHAGVLTEVTLKCEDAGLHERLTLPRGAATSRAPAAASRACRSRARPSGRPGRARASRARRRSRSSSWPRRSRAPSWPGPRS